MKYVIEDENGDFISLEATIGGAVLTLGTGKDAVEFNFLTDEFKDFRRAVGYVGQEVEAK